MQVKFDQDNSTPSRSFGRVRMLTAALVAFCGLTAATAGTASSNDQTLTLYNGQHEQMTRLLVEGFEKKTGIDVEVRNGGGPELASQILKEGKKTPADVFFTENTPELMRLQQEQQLAQVDGDTLDQVPARFNSSKGFWLGVLARQNVMVYNPKQFEPSELPKTLMDLASDRYQGEVAVSPAEGDFMPLVKAMVLEHGQEKTLQWLKDLKQNAKIYHEDSGIATAVNNGSVNIGDINNYYYYRVREQIGRDTMTAKIGHFQDGNVGNLVNVSGMAVLADAPHPKAAQKFLQFVVSKQAQKKVAESSVDFEYPLRPGVTANDQVESFSQLNPPKVKVDQLGDNSQALKLVRKAGLL